MSDEGATYPVPDARPKIEYPSEVARKAKEPCSECGKMIAVAYMRTHLREIHSITLPPGKRGRKKSGPLPGEDVVDTVLKVIFPHGIPVQHRRAVNRWEAATVAFLREVQ